MISEQGEAHLLAAPDAVLEDALPELSEVIGTDLGGRRVAWDEVRAVLESLQSDLFTGTEVVLVSEAAADLRDIASQPPVIRFVNGLIAEALTLRASDIHLEAGLDGAVARFRVDGTLEAGDAPPEPLYAAVVSRIKLLGDLNIAEYRIPQDGRIRVRLENGDLDFRVSTLPAMHGESIVLRLLESQRRRGDLDRLGMPDALRDAFRSYLLKPNGLTIVTGPAGSGKTTTLYAALNQRLLATEQVITLKDPVEYRLPGVVQVPVRSDAGVTMATVLHSVLRKDPDVVMVGEIHDAEMAGLSVQVMMTGHLVLSTLNTIDAFTTIPRLVDLEVPPYLVASTLDAVLVRRLVRRIFPGCAERVAGRRPMTNDTFTRRPHEHMRGRGCTDRRSTGFRGRIGIYELLCPSGLVVMRLPRRRHALS